MRTITKFVAADGREFNDSARCEMYERRLEIAAETMKVLGDRPTLGHWRYVQHDAKIVNAVKNELLDRMREAHPSWSWGDSKNEDIGTGNIVGRYCDDNDSPFKAAWWRLMCINLTSGREYDQPYFANHESEATGPQ